MYCFSVHSLHILLFVLFCTLCRYSCALSDLPSPPAANKINVFKPDEVIRAQKPKPEGDGQIKNEQITPKDFYSPFIFAADGVIMAVAGVNGKEPDNDKAIDILVKYTKKENNWLKRLGKIPTSGLHNLQYEIFKMITIIS